MSVLLSCPKCAYQDFVPELFKGQRAKCPKCDAEFAVSPDEYSRLMPPNMFATLEAFTVVHDGEDSAPCPSCKKTIGPRPKKGRKCPYCKEQFYIRQGVLLTPANARNHDEEFGNPLKWMNRSEKVAFRRSQTIQNLKSIRQLGDLVCDIQIQGFGGSLCCAFCKVMHGRLIPYLNATLDRLPPFEQCKNQEEGCRCSIRPVLRDDIPGVLPGE